MKHTAPYYDFHEGVKCVQDLIETEGMSWNQGNILKATVRWGCKDGSSKAYDLEKIIWFATRELQLMRGNPRTDADATGGLRDAAEKAAARVGLDLSPLQGESS